ncbi:DUF4214 domain-containing protein [Brevundimonas sp. VNH65]|uniref:DUF4214 domain-containing protein n=1 Tax=Brevundimonas sp. VNH65 TaxID=3400917 RepID=UPI003C118A1B
MRTILMNVQIPDNSWSPYHSWTSFQSSPAIQHTDNFSLYQIAIWPDERKITLYKIPNDFDNLHGYNPALLDGGLSEFVAYRESFALASFPLNGDLYSDIQSESIKDAMSEFVRIISEMDTADTYGMSFQGHGSPISTFFENRMNIDDTRELLETFRDIMGKNIDFIDFSSNCNVGSFAFLDRIGDLVSYVLASDLPVGGYLSSDNPNALASILSQPRQNYAEIWGSSDSVEDGLKKTLDYHAGAWALAGADDLKGSDQKATIYNAASFSIFAQALAEKLASENIDLAGWGGSQSTWEQLFARMNDASEIRRLFEAIFVESVDTFGLTGGEPSSGLAVAHDSVLTPRQASVVRPTSGTPEDDVVHGTVGDDILLGLEGDDTLIGDEGADQLFGYHGDDLLLGGGGEDRLFGGNGNDRLVGAAGNDYLHGGAGADIADYGEAANGVNVNLTTGVAFAGADGTDLLEGIEGVYGSRYADTLVGGGSNDQLYGNAGNDRLRGGAGDDLLDGGAGVDAAEYTHVRRAHEIGKRTGDAQSVAGREGADQLVGVENLRFADGVLSYDQEGLEAQTVRLLDTLGLTANQRVFNEWLNQLERGKSLDELADVLLQTTAGGAAINSLASNADFIAQIARVALNREFPQDLSAYLGGLIDSGQISRADAVVMFSEGLEHRLIVAPTIDAGVWNESENAHIVARLFNAAFSRLPDSGTLSYVTSILDNGGSMKSVLDLFMGSLEFTSRYGGLSNADYVAKLSMIALGRPMDKGTVGYLASQIDNGGMTRADMLFAFSESLEHRVRTASWWEQGIRTTDTGGLTTATDDDFVLVEADYASHRYSEVQEPVLPASADLHGDRTGGGAAAPFDLDQLFARHGLEPDLDRAPMDHVSPYLLNHRDFSEDYFI